MPAGRKTPVEAPPSLLVWCPAYGPLGAWSWSPVFWDAVGRLGWSVRFGSLVVHLSASSYPVCPGLPWATDGSAPAPAPGLAVTRLSSFGSVLYSPVRRLLSR